MLFLLFAIGVDILAIAVEKFIDAILKINNVKIKYNTIKDNLSNGIQGACDAIIESAPNIYAALETLFTIILAAITSIVGSVVALGVAFFLAFMDGILMALPEALRILSKIMQIIVDWLDEPGNLELFRRFFRDIGAMLVEIIGGAIEGLFHTVFEYIDKVHDEGIKRGTKLQRIDLRKKPTKRCLTKRLIILVLVPKTICIIISNKCVLIRN